MRLYRESFEFVPIFTSFEASEIDEFAFSFFLLVTGAFKPSCSVQPCDTRFLRRFNLQCGLVFEHVLLSIPLPSSALIFSHLLSKLSDLVLNIALRSFNSDSFRTQCSFFLTAFAELRFSPLGFSCSSGKNITSLLDTGEGPPSQGDTATSPAEGDCYTSFSVGELVEIELIVFELFDSDCT